MPEASELQSFQLWDIRYASLSMSQLMEEFGLAYLNHAGRQEFITTANKLCFSVSLALYLLISLYLKLTLGLKCSAIIPKISAFVILRSPALNPTDRSIPE